MRNAIALLNASIVAALNLYVGLDSKSPILTP
jgi:hypothetical protein